MAPKVCWPAGATCQYARRYQGTQFGSTVVQTLKAGSTSDCKQLYESNAQRVEVQGWYWDGFTGCLLLQLGIQRIDGMSTAECMQRCKETPGCQSVRYVANVPFCVLSEQLTGERVPAPAAQSQDFVVGCGDSGAILYSTMWYHH